MDGLEKERVVGKTERNVARIVVGSPPRGRFRIASFQYLDGASEYIVGLGEG
jgi:hypothetical protein